MPQIIRSIRDPVHGVIHFEDTKNDKLLLSIIDSKEFQRLRRIKQLGVSDYVFPGATHTRFSHSIGTLHITRLFLNRFRQIGIRISPDDEEIVLVAALLHDIGHGPFSHAFENITGLKHEKISEKIIANPHTEINSILGKERANKLLDFLRGNWRPPFLAHIISSQFDADRLDYLLRDTYSIGADYGKFDLKWLIDHLRIHENGYLYFENKALLEVEQYIFARHHMYQAVYYHKTTRAVEVMIKLLFRRFKEKLQKKSLKNTKTLPSIVKYAFLSSDIDKINLEDYLSLDDHTITEFLKWCVVSNDPILNKLADGILNRRLYKCIDVSSFSSLSQRTFEEEAKSIMKNKGISSDLQEYMLSFDSPSDTPYKVYEPVEEEKATQIFIEEGHGKIKIISNVSSRIKALEDKIEKVRYYFPGEFREDMVKLKHKIAGGEK